MRYLTLILVLFVLYAGDRSQAQTLQVKLGDYSLTGAPSPKKEGGSVGFLQAAFGKTAKGPKSFGLWYAASENAMSDVVIEVADAASKNVIKGITAADLLGKSKSESLNNGSRLTSTYQFGTGPAMVELQIETEVVGDESAPLGKKLLFTYRVRMAKGSQVNAVLRMKTDGIAQKLGVSGFASSRAENDQALYPAIVVTSLSPVNIDVAARSKGIQQIALRAENIKVQEKTWATLFSLEALGTTVKDGVKANEQANRITNRVAAKEAKPDLAIFNTANRTNTVPGDTVTYTITYCNIGSALAQDAEITNPVPEGVMLLEKSVQTSEAVVSIDRKPAVAPEIGTPTLVRWKISRKIMPGEEGKLSMKVVVR